MHGEFTWIDLSTFDVPAAEDFYRKIFGWDYTGDPRSIDGHVKNLRRKLSASGVSNPRIRTVFGVGYRLDVNEV